MSVSLANLAAVTSHRSRIETGFRRVLIGFSVIAALGILCQLGMAIWAQNEFAVPESVVGTQAMMLARNGTLYYDLNKYPYTVCAYTPLLYLLEAGATKLGLPTILSGRLISLMALIGIITLVWRLLLLYTRDRYCAWTGALLCASSAVLLIWGTVAQTDTLAVFWSIAAFYQYSRYSINGEKTLLWVGLLAALAFFTKQTTLACPTAICVHLLLRRRKTAIQFGVSLAASVLAVALTVNAALHGRFFANTVRANLNPLDVQVLITQLGFLAISVGQLILVAAAGFRKCRSSAPYIYLGFASLVFLATALKIGSDTNYQIESTILLAVCACLALHSLDFFALSFRGSKSWITMLQIPLGIHLVLNFRITTQTLLVRVATEQMLRSQIAALRPYAAGGGRLLTMDYNSTPRLRGTVEVETFIYTMMTRAGAIDPEPLRHDIAAQAFPVLFLHYDVSNDEQTRDFGSLPAVHTEEIRRHYRLVDHIPGPYFNGVYVYKPRTNLPME